MEGPARPDLRDALGYVGRLRGSQAPHGKVIRLAARVVLRTGRCLNAQVRALLTSVGCELAQETPEREADSPTSGGHFGVGE